MTDDRPQGTQLAEPFPQEQLKKHPSKGLTYVPIPEVVARLNRILGAGNWNSEIKKLWGLGNVNTEVGDYPKWAMAHVTISGVVDGVPFSYDGVGGQEVQFLKKAAGGPVDIGDSYKGAVSDATKKAAQSLGVGLELAREDDAMHYDQAAKEADQPKANQAALDRIKELAGALPEEVRKGKFNPWWAELTGDGERGKKIDSGQVTIKEAAEATDYLENLKVGVAN